MLQKYSSYIFCFLIVLFVVALSANNFSSFKKLEWKIQDFMFSIKSENPVYGDIIFVNIDNKSLREYGEWPWPHDRIADLLAAIGRGEPKTVVLDLPLEGDIKADSEKFTEILAGQMSWMNNVIVPYEYSPAEYIGAKISIPKYLYNYSVMVNNDLGVIDEKSSLLARKIFLPPKAICQYAAGFGFRGNVYDADKKIRWEPMGLHYEGYYYPSLALMATAHFKGIETSAIKIFEGEYVQMGNLKIPVNSEGNYFINYNKPHQSFPKISAADILNETYDVNKLKHNLVFLNLHTEQINYTFRTPVSEKMTAAEKTANAIENIIHNNFMSRIEDSPGINLLILLLLGGIFAFVLPRVTLKFRAIILFASFAVLTNLTFIMFNSFQIMPKSLYIFMELFLLMASSPFLDKELLAKLSTFRMGFERNEGSEKSPKLSLPRSRVITTSNDRKKKRPFSDDDDGKTGALSASDKTDLQYVPPPTDQSQKATIIDGSEISATEAVEETADKPSPIIEPDKYEMPLEYNPPSQPIDHIDGETQKRPSKTSSPDQQPVIEYPSTFGGDTGKIKNLGRYKVLGVLGKGAMGTVYKGTDPAIDRNVALKTIRLDFVNDPAELEELRERLSREAQAAGILSHPNIVTIYDVGSEGNLQYIAMEYLEGQTLEEMIRRKVKFNYRIIAQIISQICTALDYAHNQGIVHRDIKPANIMVLSDYRIKVMDFGIARVDSSSMTRTGIAMGTPNYISPEQLQGKPVDRRCDIFSLGVVTYEMLLSRRPFRGENLTSLIYAIVNSEVELPSTLDPSIPLLFDRVVEKALKKNPDERYQYASEVSAALSDFIESFSAKH